MLYKSFELLSLNIFIIFVYYNIFFFMFIQGDLKNAVDEYTKIIKKIPPSHDLSKYVHYMENEIELIKEIAGEDKKYIVGNV